jgi:hypothetical protein
LLHAEGGERNRIIDGMVSVERNGSGRSVSVWTLRVAWPDCPSSWTTSTWTPALVVRKAGVVGGG